MIDVLNDQHIQVATYENLQISAYKLTGLEGGEVEWEGGSSWATPNGFEGGEVAQNTYCNLKICFVSWFSS